MTIEEAIEVLELHNQWRKGAEIPMESPVRIGMAIDLVVCELKNLRLAHVMQSGGCPSSKIKIKMSKEIKKTSAEWIKEVGYEVLDPDGWDRTNFDYSWNKEKITMAEFERRLALSTVRRKFKVS